MMVMMKIMMMMLMIKERHTGTTENSYIALCTQPSEGTNVEMQEI